MSDHTPRKLDKVWVGSRKSEGKQPNGYIERIISYDGDKEAVVKFLDCEDRTFISFDELEGHYEGPNLGFVMEED